jgi:hypothetical protein
MKKKKKKVDPKLIERLYTTGMQLADCLRLLGEHDASHDTELWILAMVQEMKANNVRGETK